MAEAPPLEQQPPAVSRGDIAAGLAAAAAVGGAAAPMLVGLAAVKQGADTVTAGVRMVLSALTQASKQLDVAEIVAATARQLPELTEDDVAGAVTVEQRMQREFIRGMRRRVERDLPPALRIDDAAARREAVRKIVEREQRFSRMRRDAIYARLAGLAEMVRVQAESPDGALWLLSDSVRDHTPDCIAMSGKVWPWSVLKLWHPPLHFGCPCHLVGIPEALERGMIEPDRIPHAKDAMQRAREIMRKARRLEEIADPELVAEWLELVESRRREYVRWPKGSTKGGQFRPTRGGEAGRLLRDLVPGAHGRSRTVMIHGHRVAIPEARNFRRVIGGQEFTSPAGGTNLYRDGRLVSTPLAADHAVHAIGKGKLKVGAEPPPLEVQTRVRDVLAGRVDQADLTEMRTSVLDAALRVEGFVRTDSGQSETFQSYRHADGTAVTLWSADGGTLQPVGSGMRVTELMIERSYVPTAAEFKRDAGKPGDWDAFVEDARKAVGMIAVRTGARFGIAAGDTQTSDLMPDHEGTHSWEGVTTFAERIKADVNDALARAKAMKPDPFPASTYRAYHTVAHEFLHGVNQVGWRDYSTGQHAGMQLEEALTEELSHVVAQELLIDHGLGDVAQWGANNPLHSAVRGVYRRYRGQLDTLLNEAGVAAGDRPALLWSMKAGMSASERVQFLSQLTGKTDAEIKLAMTTPTANEISYLPMVTASAGSEVSPRVWKMGDHQIGRGAVAVLHDGSVMKVADAGEMSGVTFAWVYDGHGHEQIVTASDVAKVIAPGGGWGTPSPRELDWPGTRPGTTVAIGDQIDFGDGTVGEVRDVLNDAGIAAINVRTADGAVWVTPQRRRAGSKIKVTPGLRHVISMDVPPVKPGSGTWSDAGFASQQLAGEEALLLLHAPHLSRASMADLQKRQADITASIERGIHSRNDADRAELESEQQRIIDLIDARQQAQAAVRVRQAQLQRARDGFLEITQAEYLAAMRDAQGGSTRLPDGTVVRPDDLFDQANGNGKIRIVDSLPEVAYGEPLYRSDMLSPDERQAALHSIDPFLTTMTDPPPDAITVRSVRSTPPGGRFRKAVGLGEGAYLVGGAPRNRLWGVPVKDEDYMVLAHPEAIKTAAKAAGHKVEDLTVRDRLVGVRVTGSKMPPGGIEIAPPRIELSTGAGRQDFQIVPHPGIGKEPVDKLLADDAARRDFTFNALYEDAAGVIADPTGMGIADAHAKVLRTVSPDSFKEDPLRILRGLRFMSQYDVRPAAETTEQMRQHAAAVTALTKKGVSGTAREELDKILMGPHVGAALRQMRDTGVMEHFLPELRPAIGFHQESKYHGLTVDEHIISTIEAAAARGASLRVRLALLFHDAGKPESAWRGTDGHLHYYGNPKLGKEAHEDVGERIARRALRRLGYPAKVTDDVGRLVGGHMLQPTERPSKVRRLRAQYGELLDDLFAHRAADVAGKGEEHSADAAGAFDRMHELVVASRAAGEAVRRGELAVTGADIVALGVTGPAVGEVLAELLNQVIGDPSLNRRDWLLARAARMVTRESQTA